MSIRHISGMGATGYPKGYGTRRTGENDKKKNFEDTISLKAPQPSTVETMVKSTESEEQLQRSQESETKTDIIIKPDGSRVLVVTMNVGGMETTMSLEISRPTDMQSDSSDQSNDSNANNDMSASETAEV